MDELVIGEKKYISSKRAAELTGYAKDYVGQLCREGRVEARLVGRSWYVLESSISEHRFGKKEEASSAPVEVPEAVEEDVGWDSPKYVTETVAPLPELIERPRPILPSRLNLLARGVSVSVSDIPSNEAEIKTETNSRQEELPKEVSKIQEDQLDEEVVVPLHKVRGTEVPESKERDISIPKPAPRSYPGANQAAKVPKKEGSLTKSAVIIAFAVVSISIMLIGTGAVDRYLLPVALESSFIKYLGGKSIYNR